MIIFFFLVCFLLVIGDFLRTQFRESSRDGNHKLREMKADNIAAASFFNLTFWLRWVFIAVCAFLQFWGAGATLVAQASHCGG